MARKVVDQRKSAPAGNASAVSSAVKQVLQAVEQKEAKNIVRLSRIIMISWKLLAVFHDPIHDFGLNIDRMCSIVKYINDIQKLIDEFQKNNDPETNPDVAQFTGGSKKKYQVSDIHTLYLEEQNIGSISIESSEGGEPDSEDSAVTTDMIALYKSGLHKKYLDQRRFYTEKTGTTLTKYKDISPNNNKNEVYQLQLYNQFFTNITKLIDLLKVLIVIQVVEKHALVGDGIFDYNNVHKQTILSAIEDIQNALAEVDNDGEVEDIKQHYDLEIRTLVFLLTVISILFDTMSSRHCYLQLDLLNSSTFNNLVRIYFSCYFNDNDLFFNTLDKWSKERLTPLPIIAHREYKLNRSKMSDLIKTHKVQRMGIIKDGNEDYFIDEEASDLYSQVTEQEDLEDPDKFEYIELEYERESAFGGGRKKRHDSKHPFILKGGGGLSGKAKKWSESSRSREVTKARVAGIFFELVKDWSGTYQSGSKWNDVKTEGEDYGEAIGIFDRLTGEAAALLRENFPILFTKITKDIEYHKKKVDEVDRAGGRSGRTSPKSMVITKIRNYMNEIVSEVKALEAEIDNQVKRDTIKNVIPSDTTDVNTNITNPVSKLFAKKGLDYARQALVLYSDMNLDHLVVKNINTCIDYIKHIYTLKEAANKPSATGGGGNKSPQRGGAALADPPQVDNIEFEILLHHLNFLGVVYLSDNKCLPDIDGKLIRYWTSLCKIKYPEYVITQDELNKYEGKDFTLLRVINNGIPADLKDKFHDKVWCPSSSVCDSMGNFGSCAGTKRRTEFYNMSINITDEDKVDFYDVYSKIDKNTILEVVSNSFNLNFETGSMFIDAKYGNVNLNIKPEMLSANNVFKQTLAAIALCFSENGPMSVGELWASLESNDNFKRIITPTCWKATGDINQEFNSIVANGGYADISENHDIRTRIMISMTTLGLAGDRPSGVRMILLALFSLNEELLRNFVVGYANLSSGLYVGRKAAAAPVSSGLRKAAAAAPGVKASGRGGRIRKTKFRKPKIIKTRKNKSHHYKMMSKRRKYNNNKTKNRKK
jgi:hypothetical protein